MYWRSHRKSGSPSQKVESPPYFYFRFASRERPPTLRVPTYAENIALPAAFTATFSSGSGSEVHMYVAFSFARRNTRGVGSGRTGLLLVV